MVSSKGRAPILQHTDQSTRRHGFAYDIVLDHAGQSVACRCCAHRYLGVVDDQSAFNPNVQAPAALLEFPYMTPHRFKALLQLPYR